MKPTNPGEQICERTLQSMDLYLDNELPAGERAEAEQHIRECASCAAEIEARIALKDRLKTSVRSVMAHPDLQRRIRDSVRAVATPATPRHNWTRAAVAMAATLVICLGVTIAYQLGHLRLTASSQESYIATISQRVSNVMRIGLGDHVHCAVFRKQRKNPPSPEQMVNEMGPEYKDLIAVVKEQAPQGYQVVMAHQCRYHRRKFVHVTATYGSKLISLVIARRGDGESFEADKLVSQLTAAGIPMYQTSVQRFNIAGFETRDHLVYVVSDLGQRENLDVMTAFAPRVRDTLHKIEL